MADCLGAMKDQKLNIHKDNTQKENMVPLKSSFRGFTVNKGEKLWNSLKHIFHGRRATHTLFTHLSGVFSKSLLVFKNVEMPLVLT